MNPVLSPWNAECGFSFRACIHNSDEHRTALALRMVTQFAAHGEDSQLVAAGHRLCRDYPHLWEKAEASAAAQENAAPHRRPRRRRATLTRQADQPPALLASPIFSAGVKS
ncbi:MAG TPA: hypothetical protein VMB21_02645 [Candidatus Limnocylindria bacterium]|nr:hypothetical protein [Candidatus Limnocylindria bacterium]